MVPGQQAPVMIKGGYHSPSVRYGTSGAAIASIVLGIMGLLGGITAIPAIICGHKALDKIRRTNGTFDGRGIAIAGMTMGYVTLAVWVIYVIVKIVLSASGKGR